MDKVRETFGEPYISYELCPLPPTCTGPSTFPTPSSASIAGVARMFDSDEGGRGGLGESF